MDWPVAWLSLEKICAFLGAADRGGIAPLQFMASLSQAEREEFNHLIYRGRCAAMLKRLESGPARTWDFLKNARLIRLILDELGVPDPTEQATTFKFSQYASKIV
jgi:hypothetical protein